MASRVKEVSYCLQKYPHSMTGRSPAELLFNRKARRKIPDLRIDYIYDQEVHDRNAEQKAKTKDYADTQCRASHSSVKISDEVLVQQDKANKLSTAFNPTSFKVVSKNGNSLVIESPKGKQHSTKTSHVKQYLNDPTPQQDTCTCFATHRLPGLRDCWTAKDALICKRMLEQNQRHHDPRGHGDYHRH